MILEHPELTVQGIVNFAINVEEESAEYYYKAYKRLGESKNVGNEVLLLLAFLQDEEMRHKQVIQDRFKSMIASGVALNYGSLHNAARDLVLTPKISDSSSSKEVLEIAMRREEKTAALYRILYTLSELEHMAPAFKELIAQEEEHMARIKKSLRTIFNNDI